MKLAIDTMRIKALLLGSMLLLLCGLSHAENGCPPGMIPEGGQGVSSCRPIPGYSQPQGHWVNQWGAIAMDTSHKSAGASINQSSEVDAEQAAIANCVSNGGVLCKVEITYVNQCVALVEGNAGHNVNRADTLKQAIGTGMKTCVDAGDANCHAYYTSCNTPKWVQ